MAAFAGESQARNRYTYFATKAKKEGFHETAVVFCASAIAEAQHEKRYLALAANIENDRIFKREAAVTWRCRNCGYLHTGTEEPQRYPACAHPQAHFELLGENW